VGSASEGTTLAAIRIGVVLSLWLSALADRRGRRRLLLICAVGGVLATAVGALSPDLVALGATQTVAEAFTTTLALLLVVVAAEEMPRSARAYALGMMAMTAGLGGGMCVWLLPLAGLGLRWWRVLYVTPLLALPVIAAVARGLPESRRFVANRPRDPVTGHRRRLGLLAGTAFLGAMFLAPAAQFQNDFLRHEHHFSATRLTIFTLLTSTPAGIGILVGGRLADSRGRRVIGAFGVAAGTILTVISFQVGGPWLWITALLGTTVAATTIPALGVYGPELFPTTLRGLTSGIITLVGVLGSATGLVIAGRLNEHYGHYGPGIALVGIGPLVVAVLVLAFYPETAHRSLEDLNPEDEPLPAFDFASAPPRQAAHSTDPSVDQPVSPSIAEAFGPPVGPPVNPSIEEPGARPADPHAARPIDEPATGSVDEPATPIVDQPAAGSVDGR
jgi:MFS family permease